MNPMNLSEMNRIWLSAMQDMFRASMSAMTTFQEEVVRMSKAVTEKNSEAWQLNQSMVDEWIATVQKGQDEFRKLVDENFLRAQAQLDALRKSNGQ